MDIITGHLEKDSNKSMAKFLAFNIEAALDRKFSGDNKGYTEKFRTLNFNMKRNEVIKLKGCSLLFLSFIFCNCVHCTLATAKGYYQWNVSS